MTKLTELSQFFPSTGTATFAPQRVRIAPMRQGETLEQAIKRQDETTARIAARLAKNKAAA